MYVTYFDEVKPNPPQNQNTYFVGGIAVPIGEIQRMEAAVSAIAEDVFGSVELTTATEFHASHIYFGKGPFKGMPPKDRIAILARLADLLADGQPVRRMYAAIDTTKLMAAAKAAEFAFAHFCERAQLAIGPKNLSLVIGDLDDNEAKNMIRDFAKFRAKGTPWDYGIEVKSFVDTVHFARSHHSRMIQLADVYVFIVSHQYGTRGGWMADELTKALKDKNLYPHRYKDWPK